MDQRPPYNYRCVICKAVGHHFATLCPENTKELSLTQLRRKAGITNAPRDDQEPVRGERHDQDRHYQDLVLEKSRSQSPFGGNARDSRDGRQLPLEYDSYRPREPRRLRFPGPLVEDDGWGPVLDPFDPFRAIQRSPGDDKKVPYRTRGMEGRLSFHDDVYHNQDAIQSGGWTTSEDHDPSSDEAVQRSTSPERAARIKAQVDAFFQSLEAETLARKARLAVSLGLDPETIDNSANIANRAVVHDYHDVSMQTNDCATAQTHDLASVKEQSHSPTQ